jgi:hypothetical protein
MKTQKFAYIWQYQIKDDHRADFLAAYESSGKWAQLFQKDEAYIETILLVDDSDPDRFITIDFWTSKTGRDDFRNRYRSEYVELDGRCEEFTVAEGFIGDFVVASRHDP